MEIKEIFKNEGTAVRIYNADSFRINEVLECGQCFRFERLDEGKYLIIAKNRVLYVTQTEEHIEFFPSTKDEFESLWMDYFDFNNDYGIIKETLRNKDAVLENAIAFADGIRLLNQEPFETLISFIISQNNRIPMIKKVISNISQSYGNPINGHDGFYTFPEPNGLSRADEAALSLCKTGFRAKYIVDAVSKCESLGIFGDTSPTDTLALKKSLMTVNGIGDKVADCILLFSLRRREVFPIDVWVKRVMEHFYFNGKEVHIRDIAAFAAEHFGSLAGYAQQYLFYYARELSIGAKNGKNNRKISKNKSNIVL